MTCRLPLPGSRADLAVAATALVAVLGVGCVPSGGAGDGSSNSVLAEHYEPTSLDPPERGIQLHIGPFDLGPGEELYYCRIMRLPTSEVEDVVRLHHRASAVHHFNVWALSSGPDEELEGPCEDLWALTSMALAAPLYASQDREFDGRFPDGVAGQLPAGQQLLLEFHSLNPTDQQVVAEAFLNAEWAEEGSVEVYANGLFGSNTALDLPPGEEVTVSKRCLVDSDMQVFALGSHFHKTGLRFEILLLDEAGEPSESVYTNTTWESASVSMRPDDPIVLSAGGGFEYRCTFLNYTDQTIGYGLSVDDEMCMMAAVYFPDDGFKVCDLGP